MLPQRSNVPCRYLYSLRRFCISCILFPALHCCCYIPFICAFAFWKLGYGLGGTVLGSICFCLGVPAPILLWKYGARLRSRSEFAFEKSWVWSSFRLDWGRLVGYVLGIVNLPIKTTFCSHLWWLFVYSARWIFVKWKFVDDLVSSILVWVLLFLQYTMENSTTWMNLLYIL